MESKMGNSSRSLFLIANVFLTSAVFTGNYFETSAEEASFCGKKDPDPEKTCVSLRLPWQEEPIYFCTEKENIKYRSQCGNQGSMHCPNQWSREVLLLATPWDCCPLSSIPDHCVNAQCPPKPLNRTCETIAPPEDSPWDCCPKYFCDESGRTQKDCHLKQLERGCTTPPKGKSNCVPFFDQHGCCTKYQCDGDGKPGMCPMQAAAMRYSANALGSGTENIMSYSNRMDKMESLGGPNVSMSNGHSGMKMEETTAASMPETMATTASMKQEQNKSAPQMSSQMNSQRNEGKVKVEAMDAGVHGGNVGNVGNGMEMSPPRPHHPPPSYSSYSSFAGDKEKHGYSISVESPSGGGFVGGGHIHIPCVGDFNCPGVMKCCSHDIASYSDNSALMKNNYPTHGFCVEPVMN